jgi:hypothetical protein
MPNRSRKTRKVTKPRLGKPGKVTALPTKDANEMAFDAIQRVIARTEETGGKNPAAVALGRLGGLRGGRARAEALTEEERSQSAAKAAWARWSKKSPKSPNSP